MSNYLHINYIQITVYMFPSVYSYSWPSGKQEQEPLSVEIYLECLTDNVFCYHLAAG